jgi:(2R)-3-sulfolactate dehydrogenase (NADP+)
MTTTTIAAKALEDFITAALCASRTAPPVAAAVARALTQAEIDGQKGHGLSRVPSYAAQARSGKVDGFAKPTAQAPRPGTLLIDAKNGFAYPAIDLALNGLPAACRASGIAAAAITRSHHCGVVGWHLERLAVDHGLVGLMFANTPHAMAAVGGQRPVFGTNPIGFGVPRRAAPPIVIDMALSQVARGKILTASQKGEQIPSDWALDAEGKPTTDAHEALKGTLRPLGGAKGAALALMVEVLAVALGGATLAADAASFFDASGTPPGTGQLILAIDPGAFAGPDVFHERLEALATMIASDRGARLPGERKVALRSAAVRDGVAVDAKLLADVEALARA